MTMGSIKSCLRRLLLVIGLVLLAGFSSSQEVVSVDRSMSKPFQDCVGRESEKLFVLSFDDGPWSYTSRIMDILGQKGAPATFFVIGSNFDAFPEYKEDYEDLIRRMIREGHVVGNHGIDNDEFTMDDVIACHNVIKEISGGTDMHFFRPARGAYTKEKFDELVDSGYSMVMWNLDVEDWRSERTPEQILDIVTEAVQNPTMPAAMDDIGNYGFPRQGSYIMLAHDVNDKMLQPVHGGESLLLEAMIDVIHGAGYRIVSLNECLGVKVEGTKNYCGKDFGNAQTCKADECPSGMDEECPAGMTCFGSVHCLGDDATKTFRDPSGMSSVMGDSELEDGEWDWSRVAASGSPAIWCTLLPTFWALVVGSFLLAL